MSTDAIGADAAAAVPAADKPASNKQIVVIAILALAGTVAGAAAGAMVVAPRVIAHQTPISADSAKALAEAAAAKAEGGEGKAGEKKVIKVENVIVNPAGTNGTRYLMASFGIEVGTAETEKKLTENEVQVRDRITSVLQSQNLAFLTAPWARDSVKSKVAEALREITGPKASIKVYVPQFVIQ